MKKWTEERTNELLEIVGGESPVSVDTLNQAAETLDVSVRSVGSKLRNMGHSVASMAKATVPTFTDSEGQALSEFVTGNSGIYTYGEVAERFQGGQFTSKQVQGKILAMELTGHIKPTEKKEAVLKYTVEEEARFVKLVSRGESIDAIAEKMGRTINSARGKALALLRAGKITAIPAQEVSTAKTKEDSVAALGDISGMTVEQIASATGKTERGVRTLLTRRGISCANYDGAAKREKADAKKGE